MKILLLTNKPPWPPFVGGAIATLNMIKSLSLCGASITVLYMNTSKHYTPVQNIPEEFQRMASFNSV